MITVAPLPPGLTIVEKPAPAAPSPDIRQKVDALWQEEQRRRGASLTNGRIFSLEHRDGATFTVWEAQYKSWIAQRRDPALFASLAIRPLAISGIIRLKEGLVFARRANSNTQDPGLWELPPSGGIDVACRRTGGIIAAEAQVLAELEEELAVPTTALDAPPRAIAVMEDTLDRVTDIVFALQLGWSGATLAEAFTKSTAREYTALRIADACDAAASFAPDGGLSPASQALLDHLAVQAKDKRASAPSASTKRAC